MPRIAIVAPFKAWGGIERKIVILCQEFLRLGVMPELVLLRGGVRPYPDLLPSEVRVIDLKTHSKLDGIPKFISYLRKERPDAIITAKVHSAQLAIIARMLSGVRVPIMVKVTNTFSIVARKKSKRLMIRWLFPYADSIVAISQGVANDLQTVFGIPGEKISVIYNPIGRDIKERARALAEHPWFNDNGPPVILGAGRLTTQKDFSTLLRSFAKVRQLRDCRLVILGEGSERASLESLVRDLKLDDCVSLPGVVTDPLAYMHQAALFVLSSRYEGLGNVLIEAIAAGAPVVSTDCPSGPAEILQDGRYGRLVPTADPDALANAIVAVLDDRENFIPPVEALARFQPETVAKQYLQLLGLYQEKAGL